MKIEIDLLNEPTSYKIQLLAVNKYIQNNITNTEDFNFFGEPCNQNDLTLYTKVKLKETPKGTSTIIKLDETYRKFYISCRKTPTMYKFTVRNAQ